MSLFLLLLLFCTSEATGFFGTVMSYIPKTSNNGNVTVVIRYKMNFHFCNESATWQCLSGSCGSSAVVLNTVYSTSSGEWCQTEGIMTREAPSGAFELGLNSGTWTNNLVNRNVFLRARTVVDLRNRSDTGQVNRSPQTTILPVLRVPSNCLRQINLLAFDPDGDEVKCRYSKLDLLECITCTPPPVLSLSSSCDLLFKSNSSSDEGLYAVQLMMEDFPRQTIGLTSVTGTQTLTSRSPVSSIPVQFVFKVDPAVPSCTEGLYLPMFLSPTPANSARLYTPVNQTLDIVIRAAATSSLISELLFSGPHNVKQSSSGPGQFTLRWTPSQSEDGESQPICFVVQALSNSTKYNSELRCVIVTVGNATVTQAAIAITTATAGPTPVPEPSTIITNTTTVGPVPEPSTIITNTTTGGPVPEPSTIITNTTTVGPGPEPSTIITNTTAVGPGPEPSTINNTIATVGPVPEPSTIITNTTTVGPVSEPSTIITNTTTGGPVSEPSTIITNTTTGGPVSEPSTIITNTTTGGPTPSSQQIVIRLTARISSGMPLSEEVIFFVIQQFKNELVRQGLPSSLNLTLLRKVDTGGSSGSR